MTLRARLTMLTAAAVALAIIAAAAVAWLLVRSSMMDEVDEELLARSQQVDRIAAAARVPGGGSQPELQLVEMVQADPVGVQVIDANGSTYQVTFEPLTTALKGAQLPEAGPPGQPQLQTLRLGGESYRVLTHSAADGHSVLRLFQPLNTVEATLDSVAWSLTGTALAGIALAAVLGWMVSRTALRPVERLVSATEEVAATQDLSHRIDVEVGLKDEISRLGASVNQMLAALERARGEQRELVENASHELRTPLAVLRNDLGLLAKSEEDPQRGLSRQDRAELMQDLDAQLVALTEEVSGIITLAKGDQHDEPPQLTELSELITRAVQRSKRVNPLVAVEVHAEPCTAVVHPAALERAVANLVRNALQVSSPNSIVTVRLIQQEQEVAVVVEDNGPGLQEDEIPRLFTRFFRGSAARQRHGSGLGLAIVAQAAALHGGSAEAANRADGGARFTLRWPRR